jgi:hypothetical protein
MTAQALTALQDSIQHWERLASGDRNKDEFPSSGNCALCTAFYYHGDLLTVCEGCPIRNFTGQTRCHDTPFDVAANLARDNKSFKMTNKKMNTKKFKDAAADEVEFLKSLLPEQNGL